MQCGAATYMISADPLFTYACHCGSCQKRTGSAFSLGLVIATAALDYRAQASGTTTR